MSERPGIGLDEWYPLIAGEVLTPRTVIVRASEDLAPLAYGEGAPDVRPAAKALAKEIDRAAISLGGYPVFLRTGHTSGKHEWRRTCYLTGSVDIPGHIFNLVEVSELVDMFGLPTEVWAVRELLKTTPAFHAFEGMPITKERRYFVIDGTVVGFHPYWPPEAITNPSTSDWRWRLDRIQHQPQAETNYLTLMSERVGELVPGAWSIDWLWAQGQWYLTDMAWAERSYVWWQHPTAPDRRYEGEGQWLLP